ncbi:conserved exported hypothetical protein [Hyella patelloides LEGE 07179]|uniref:Magnetosome protein MamS/MamX domain-containing protein n=1 Tax=Hyella patelloides LEGE 07179 TaxID=945734 RepID=A0A563VLL0_9CYAN|nr:hypothetical protein [Hyella patelloides]VEP12301.1 conserved exported hypothetical protein [Hyella patelloides LEGE 07179]
MNTKLTRKILAATITSLILVVVTASPVIAEEPIDSTEYSYPYCCDSTHGRHRGSYSRRYNTDKIETLNGEVVSVDTYKSPRGIAQGIHLLVNTGEETIEVHLGPSWYLEERDFEIAPEDKIAITGSRIDFNGEQGIIARQLKKGNETLVLRDEYGYPLWRGQGRGWRQ